MRKNEWYLIRYTTKASNTVREEYVQSASITELRFDYPGLIYARKETP